MSVAHISDEQIQEYLDNRDSKRDIVLIRHIRQCGECRAKLHHYRLLYRGLVEADEVNLSSDFTARTMKAVRALPEPVEQGNRGIVWAAIGAIAAMVVATVYFFGTSWIFDSTGALVEAAGESHFGLIDTVVQAIGRIQDGATILAAVAVILAITALLDKAIGKTKLKRISPLSL